MEAVQNRLRKKFPEVGELKLHACSWSQVMDEYKCAEKCYKDESLKGRRGKIKQCLRKIGESTPVFHNWIGLLPAGDYGSSICGKSHYSSEGFAGSYLSRSLQASLKCQLQSSSADKVTGLTY